MIFQYSRIFAFLQSLIWLKVLFLYKFDLLKMQNLTFAEEIDETTGGFMQQRREINRKLTEINILG